MFHRLIFALLMSFFLAFLMTAWVTWLNLGGDRPFFQPWLTAFASAWPAAALIAFLVGPFVQKITVRIVNQLERTRATRTH